MKSDLTDKAFQSGQTTSDELSEQAKRRNPPQAKQVPFDLTAASAEARFALHAVHQAALLIRGVQAKMVSPPEQTSSVAIRSLSKDDRSPVTVADFASQALVGYLLANAFPDDTLVAEEDSHALRDPAATQTLEQVTHFVACLVPQATPQAVCEWIDRGTRSTGRDDPAHRFWTLDPIDGTKGFLRGDQYVVALALIVGGQVQIGVLGCPNLPYRSEGNNGPREGSEGSGSLVIAVRDQGTWITPLIDAVRELPAGQEVPPFGQISSAVSEATSFRRLRVSDQADPSQARLLRSFESGHTNVDQIDLFAQVMGIRAEPVRMDSQAKYTLLAAGKGELLLRLLSPAKPDYREKIWDQAAGSLVLEEAGGRITDLNGKPLDFTTGRTLAHNRGILASNGLLHPHALQALQAIRA